MRPYARPPGQRHRGQRGVHAELAQHVLHVGADGVRGQEQPRRHVLAAQPRHHAAQHLVLARGQRLHQPFAVRPVLAGRRQLAQDPGEQRGRQVGLLPQDSPNDGQQPRERAVLRHPARGPGLERERGPARVVPLGEDHGAHPWVGRPHPGDQRDPVRAGRRPRTRLPLDGDDSGRAAEVGVDQQDVEAAALGHRAFETAHGGRRTAGRGHVDVRLGRERGCERFGEDAVVVDHENPDTSHKTPKGRGTDDGGYGARTG